MAAAQGAGGAVRVGFFAGSAPGGPQESRSVEGYVRLESRVGYWDGED